MTAGFIVIAVLFAAMVAVSHPTATALALSLVVGTYGLSVLLRRSTLDRTLELCGPRFCLQFRLRLG